MLKALTATKVFSLLIGVAAGFAFAEDTLADQIDQNAKRPARPQSSTEMFAPSGLVVVLPPGGEKEQKERVAINNPYISGVAVQMNWRDIEPTEARPRPGR